VPERTGSIALRSPTSRCIGVLRGESLEDVGEVEKLLEEREDDLEKLIAISHVKRAAEEGVTRARLEEMREWIERDVGKFRALLGGRSILTLSVTRPPSSPGERDAVSEVRAP
jgi:hypothetical protein